jgi:hypothetical protein
LIALPGRQRLKELNALRKPTGGGYRRGASLKYVIALYCDPEIGPYLPGRSQWSATR